MDAADKLNDVLEFRKLIENQQNTKKEESVKRRERGDAKLKYTIEA
jgi:hypothetical protein